MSECGNGVGADRERPLNTIEQMAPTVLSMDSLGMCAGALWRASPHFDERPGGEPITLAVIHGISLPPSC